ncbi:cache domain-containing protein, partial [Jiella marina]|uniref:cache domain-containing protein n=1 Tax=Jiella sp. LLJ827 TaxID=2917712 RepID=UPI00210124EC|nr:methyl-accepting chemotaxis protein [Jiella sp. LLJ827]
MQLTIPGKLTALVATSLVICAALVAIGIKFQHDLLLTERQNLIKTQVESAISVANQFQADMQAGILSEAQARRAVIEKIGAIRYNGTDYVFLTDMEGISLSNPNPAVVGKDLSGLKDANGVYFVRELAEKARNGGGFTTYQWPRVPDGPGVDKLSYSAELPGWGWVVGTGVYLDDISAITWSSAVSMILWTAPLFVLLGALAWKLSSSITRPIDAITGTMRRLAAGDKSVAIPGADRQDEIGAMAAAVETFKTQAIERDRLEGEANAARLSQEEAKQRQVELEHSKAEDLRAFMGVVDASFDRLSSGDLTVRMSSQVAPEFEPIRAKFNASVEELEQAIGHVVGSVGTIRTGLSEITVASNDLAHRTEQQAANLEQTVAALGEVTSGVNQTAEGAGAARKSAETARTKAEKGGQIVAQAVTAMNEIETSS